MLSPIDFGVKLIEPGEAENEAICSKVCDIEPLDSYLQSSCDLQVDIVGDSSTFILGFVDIVEDAGLWEALHVNVETFYCFLVYKVVSGTTVK